MLQVCPPSMNSLGFGCQRCLFKALKARNLCGVVCSSVLGETVCSSHCFSKKIVKVE